MKKTILAIALLAASTAANAIIIHDYDFYKDEGYLQDVLDKVYFEDHKKLSKKVIKRERKIVKTVLKDKPNTEKKVSRLETKIARNITAMDIVNVVLEPEEPVSASVSEPSPLLLVGLGIAGLAVSRKFLNK